MAGSHAGTSNERVLPPERNPEASSGTHTGRQNKELEELDVPENVPEGVYRRDTYLVLGQDGGWQHADLYRVSDPAGPYTPSPVYVEHMIEGDREHGLDPQYVARRVAVRKALD